jgi:cytochrome c-type biogenesis protein CcmH
MTTTFWLVAAALMAVGVLMLAPALLKRRQLGDADRDAQNVAIARERLQELEAERDRGELTPAAFQQARLELERILASDLAGPEQAAAVRRADKAGPLALAGLLVAIPPVTIALYLALGAPEHLGVVGPGAGSAARMVAHGTGDGQTDMGQMLGRLEQRLAQNPNDPEGWAILARSYMALERYPDAVRALEKLRELVGDEPAILIPLADSIAMTQGGNMAGRPAALVKKALETEPDNPIANWLAGNAAAESKDWQGAVDHWRKSLAQVGDDAQAADELQQRIADAETRLGGRPAAPAAAPNARTAPQAGAAAPSAQTAPRPATAAPAAQTAPQAATAAPAAARLQVQVQLAAELKDRVAPTDTVFVFARAPAGPPMPVAAVRLQASQLPLTVTLDDGTSLMPGARLSQFPEVRVEARVSKSGNAAAAAGDLRGEVSGVKVASPEAVVVVIDNVLP